MKKTEKLSILISIVLISLLAISAVSAAEADDTPLTETSSDGAVSEPSTTDVQVKDTQDTTTTKESSSTDTVKAEPKTTGSFTDLDNDTNTPFQREEGKTTIDLDRNYTYNPELDTGFNNGVILRTSELNNHTMTIDGHGHTINGNDQANIFQVKDGMNVVLKNLIITKAKNSFLDENLGAAITVDSISSLTIINVTFVNNAGIVIENNGTLTVENSNFTHNLYAIASIGNGLNIDNMLSNGVTTFLSGLSTYDVTIKNTTFDTTPQCIYFANNTVKIINSTFKDLQYAIRAEDSVLNIVEDTLFDNSYVAIGLNNSGLKMDSVKFIMQNRCPSSSMAIQALNNTEINMNAVEFINNTIGIMAENNTKIFADNVNFTNTSIMAIGVLNNSEITVHNSNFINSTQGAITAVNSTIELVNSNFTNNTEAAIAFVNSNLTADTINFTGSVFAITNTMEGPEDFEIGENVANIEIKNSTFIDNGFSIYVINSANAKLNILDGTKFINNTDGIFAINATMTVVDALFENNTLGAIDLHNGILDVSGVTVFKNNKDSAIFAKDANVTITGAKFEGNQADKLFDDIDDANGGAINIENGNLKITNTEFTNNTAQNGGAIYSNGNLTVTDSDFTNNKATTTESGVRGGGAIYTIGNATITGTFTNNTAIRAGAILNNGKAIITGTFTNNTATSAAAGAIYNGVNGNATISGTFTNNKATAGYGGAIYNYGGIATITGTFTNNSGTMGGAISANTNNEVNPETTVYTSKFIGNTATAENGGAIHNTGVMNITESEFTNNIATQDGGAIYNYALGANEINEDPAIKILDTDFKNNNANRNGAEIYTRHPTDGEYYHHTKSIRITDSTISNNIATNKNNLLYCTIEDGAISYACIELNNVDIYTQIVTYNATILNNVTDKVVLFFKINEEGTDKPLFDNLTIRVDDILYTDAMSYEPYLIEGLTPGIHIISVVYGGTPYNYELAYDEIVINVTESVATLQEKLDNATRNASELDKQLKDAQKQVADLTEQLANATGNASELDKQLKDAQKQVADLTAQLNAANAEITTTKAALDNANSQITTLTSQLTAANKKADDANAKIKKVKAKSKIKKSKKFKVTVTLSKKISGKYVYVIFNGKSYKAKAKNGVAKITIKKSALKKLGGKKVKYQIVYNQSLKNKTVKIKK